MQRAVRHLIFFVLIPDSTLGMLELELLLLMVLTVAADTMFRFT